MHNKLTLDFVSFSNKDRHETEQMGKNRAMWRNPWLMPQGGGVEDYYHAADD